MNLASSPGNKLRAGRICAFAQRELRATSSAELPLRSVALTLIELLLIIALTFSTSALGQTLTNPAQQFQQAIHLMETKGDYAGAIKLFDEIARGADRSLAARALLYLGFCFEKTGKEVARRKYQQLIKEFGDQPKLVALARERLAALESELSASRADVVARRIWAEGGGYSDSGGFLAIAASPNGRYLAMSFPEGGASELFRFEVATGEKLILTKATPEDEAVGGGSQAAIFSPDGRQIAFDWYGKEGYDVQLIDVDGTNRRRLYKSENVDYAWPVDWSNDGRHLLTLIKRKGGSRLEGNISVDLALLDVADGSERVLTTFPRDPSNPTFSPDGRYVVYNSRQNEQVAGKHDIYLLDTEQNQIVWLVEHPAHEFVLGWAPDGKRLLFASDRTGNVDVWLLNVEEGKPRGQPQLIKRDLGQIRPISLTRNGAFFYRVHAGLTDVWIATLDPATGKILEPPAIASPNYIGFNRSGAWSRDGHYLAYLSGRGRPLIEPFGQPFLVIRLTDTGEERVIEPDLNWINHLRLSWHPDGRSILVTGHDRKDQMGIYQIDVQSGEVTLIHTEPKTWFYQAAWSLDGTSIFYDSSGEGHHLHSLDLASRRVQDIFSPDPKESFVQRFDLSPDGRQIMILHGFKNGEPGRIEVIPSEGGKARRVYVIPKEDFSIDAAWMADGRHILFNKCNDEQTQDMLWRVSIDGGEAENLGIEVGRLPHIQSHPDGRQIAYTTSKGKNEVWVMENFLPPVQEGK